MPYFLAHTGDNFGDYEIIEFIGEGASSETYKARASDGSLVALKIIWTNEVEVKKELKSEREVLERAGKHPNWRKQPDDLSAGFASGCGALQTSKNRTSACI